MPTLARTAASSANTDVSVDDSRIEPAEASTSAAIACGRTIGTSGTIAASRCRTAGSRLVGSPLVRSAMAIDGTGDCAYGTYASGTGGWFSPADRTSPTTPITSRTTVTGSSTSCTRAPSGSWSGQNCRAIVSLMTTT